MSSLVFFFFFFFILTADVSQWKIELIMPIVSLNTKTFKYAHSNDYSWFCWRGKGDISLTERKAPIKLFI